MALAVRSNGRLDVNNHAGVVADNPERQMELLTAKLNRVITDGNARSKSALETIERDGNMLEDFIAYMGPDAAQHGKPVMRFQALDNQLQVLQQNGKQRIFTLHPHAAVQAGTKLGIPPAYIRDLSQSREPWQAALAARILNDHSGHSERQRLLVRAVGQDIRGILSDKYRRLDTRFIAQSFISSVQDTGAMIFDAHASDTKWWIEAIHPQILPVPTPGNGTLYMAFGSRLASSDFADSTLDLRFYMLHVWCLNGVVMESVLRQVHIGGRIPEDLQLSKQTYVYDSKTQAGIVRDVVRQLFSRGNYEKRVALIQNAAAEEVDMDAEVKRLPKLGLLKMEADEVGKVLVNNRSEDGALGAPTLWRLAQAVGAVARDKEPRRRREIEELAGALLSRASRN